MSDEVRIRGVTFIADDRLREHETGQTVKNGWIYTSSGRWLPPKAKESELQAVGVEGVIRYEFNPKSRCEDGSFDCYDLLTDEPVSPNCVLLLEGLPVLAKIQELQHDIIRINYEREAASTLGHERIVKLEEENARLRSAITQALDLLSRPREGAVKEAIKVLREGL